MQFAVRFGTEFYKKNLWSIYATKYWANVWCSHTTLLFGIWKCNTLPQLPSIHGGGLREASPSLTIFGRGLFFRATGEERKRSIFILVTQWDFFGCCCCVSRADKMRIRINYSLTAAWRSARSEPPQQVFLWKKGGWARVCKGWKHDTKVCAKSITYLSERRFC